MEDSINKRFSKQNDDEEIIKRLYIGFNKPESTISQHIWCSKSSKFLESTEIEFLDDIFFSSEYVGEIVDKGRVFFEDMIVKLKIKGSMRRIHQRKGIQGTHIPRLTSDWLCYYLKSVKKNVQDLNSFVNNYCIFTQENQLVYHGVVRKVKELPLNLFFWQEDIIPNITPESSEKEMVSFCKWVLKRLFEIKTTVTQIVHILELLRRNLDKECEKYGVVDPQIIKMKLKGFRMTFLELVIDFEADARLGTKRRIRQEDEGENIELKKQRFYHHFL